MTGAKGVVCGLEGTWKVDIYVSLKSSRNAINSYQVQCMHVLAVTPGLLSMQGRVANS